MKKPDLMPVSKRLDMPYFGSRERYLPTAFNGDLTLLEKLDTIIYYLNKYSLITEEMLGKWNEVYRWVMGDGLKESVNDQLKNWLDDGTILDIINNGIFKEINEKINTIIEELSVMQSEINNITDEMENKINQKIEEMERFINSKLLEFENEINEFIKEIPNLIKTIENKLYKFDLTDIPDFYINLELYDPTIFQCFRINEKTQEIYVSQVAYGGTESGKSQSFRLNRLTMSGELLDSMLLKYGGHGTSFGIENTDNGVRIWSIYDNATSDGTYLGSHQLVTFPYLPNQTIDNNSQHLTRYNRFHDKPVTPAIDVENDRILFRIGTDNDQSIEIRKLSDVKKGVNNVLSSFKIPSELKYLQGMAINGDKVYWYTGDTNYDEFPNYVTIFDKNGKIEKQFTPFLNSKPEKNIIEPEGIEYVKNSDGFESLIVGYVTGEPNQRNNKLYVYNSLMSKTYYDSFKIDKGQLYKITDNKGYAKEFPNGLTELSRLKSYGHFYLSSQQANSLVDFPVNVSSGWFLYNAPPTWNGSTFQLLYRFSSHEHNTDTYYRMMNNFNPSPWQQLSGSVKWDNVVYANNVESVSKGVKVGQSIGTSTGVVLRGACKVNKSYNLDTAIFTVPEKLRPTEWVYFLASVNDDSKPYVYCVMKSDGTVYARSNFANGKNIYFDNVQYYRN